MLSTLSRPVVSVLLGLLLASCGTREALVDDLPVEPPTEMELELSHRNSEPVAARMEELRREIAAQGGDHPWAGEYYFGDGLGVNITLLVAPSGYVYVWRGCMGVYGERVGTLAVQDRRLRLAATPPPDASTPGLAAELLIVPWGQRTYLLDPAERDEFRRDADEPRSGVHGSYLLREGDEARATWGEPQIPE